MSKKDVVEICALLLVLGFLMFVMTISLGAGIHFARYLGLDI